MRKHHFNTSTRKIIPQEGAADLLRPHFSRLLKCQQDAWASWEELATVAPGHRKPLDSTTRANYIWNHTKENVKKFFKSIPGIAIRDKGRFFALDIAGVALLRFKKLTKNYRSHNVPTDRQLQLAMQIQTENDLLPGMPDEATWLTCGYVLGNHDTEIKECVVTCVVNTRVKYVIPLAPEKVVVEEIPAPQRVQRRANVSPIHAPKKPANRIEVDK